MESPFGSKAQCSKCDSEESNMWHRTEEGVQCCNCVESAQLALKAVEKEEQKSPVSSEKAKSPSKRSIRSTRSYKTRQNPYAIPKQVAPKGKGRRQIFKKTLPVKLPTSRSTYTTVESLFHENIAYRIGDIVSCDTEERTYYAQINGLMIDQYGEKSASINWLVPNRVIPETEDFHPLDYRLSLNDDLPRSLDCLTFVMHSPYEYFRNNYPHSCNPRPVMSNVIWGRLSHLW